MTVGTPFTFPALALLLVGLLSVVIAPNTIAALGLWRAYLLEPILVIPLLLSTLREEKMRRLLLRVLALEALAIAAIAVLQTLGFLPIIEPWAAERRATSIYPFPNAIGLFLGPLVPFFATLALFWRSNLDRPLFSLVALISLLSLFASQTEAAIVAVILALFLLALLKGGPVRRGALTLVFFAALVLAAEAPLRDTLIQKLTFHDWSGTVRRVMWKETLTMLSTRPLFGAGLSGYPSAVAPFHPDTKVEIFQYPHNIFLNIWSELGLLGLLGWAWVGAVFLRTLKLGQGDATWHLRLAAGLAILTIFLHGLVDVPYFKNDLAILTWLLLVLPFATRRENKTMLP